MVIDTSAVLAILLDEPERRAFNESLEDAASRKMSVASFVETSIVIGSRAGAAGLQALDHFIEAAAIELVPVDLDQGKEASRAFTRFGKGRHPAGLNYGDCFSYALCRCLGESLLFKGGDFARTDVVPAAVRERRSGA